MTAAMGRIPGAARTGAPHASSSSRSPRGAASAAAGSPAPAVRRVSGAHLGRPQQELDLAGTDFLATGLHARKDAVDVFVGEQRVPGVALIGRHADRVAFAGVVSCREEGAGAL